MNEGNVEEGNADEDEGDQDDKRGVLDTRLPVGAPQPEEKVPHAR